jgi:hypothetical protein
MGKKRHSIESIILTLQNLAKRLNKDSLSTNEAQSVIPQTSLRTYFGSLGNALEAAGLKRITPWEQLNKIRTRLTKDDLFRSILEVENVLGREPKEYEYISNGAYSSRPFRVRFGSWFETPTTSRILTMN